MDITKVIEYHKFPIPGKIGIRTTKPLSSKHDLALAYTPGVADACLAIKHDPDMVNYLTNKANMLAIITDGTAVLGLGDTGPLAAKPVMEGKSALFKKFSGLDVIDLELSTTDPEKIADVISYLAPSFGGIVLEDIKAPGCFFIEEYLTQKLNIPVFHDDQHGSAIVACAAVKNALHIVNKNIKDIKCVISGAGAAAIATAKLLMAIGLPKNNIFMCDSKGVITLNRSDLNKYKIDFAQDSNLSTISQVIKDADLFIGLSQAKALTPSMVASMAKDPIILALANPTPEIMPYEVESVRDDALIGTGRSDFPNQVNNVLCFPYILRGALDVRASKITDNMKIACVDAIADIARHGFKDEDNNYDGITLEFGRDYFMPLAFDKRLLYKVSTASALAAINDGVASKEINVEEYQQHLAFMVSMV